MVPSLEASPDADAEGQRHAKHRKAGLMPRVDKLDMQMEQPVRHVKALLGVPPERNTTPPWERTQGANEFLGGSRPAVLPAPLALPLPEDRPSNSRQMRRIVGRQQGPAVFDARRVYAGTELLGARSPNFLFALQEAMGGHTSRGRLVDPGQVLAREGADGGTMFIVHRGELSVTQQGEQVRTLSEGDCWGQSVVLGVTPYYNGTLTAIAMSHVFEVTSMAYMKALAAVPEERKAMQATAAARREQSFIKNNDQNKEVGVRSARGPRARLQREASGRFRTSRSEGGASDGSCSQSPSPSWRHSKSNHEGESVVYCPASRFQVSPPASRGGARAHATAEGSAVEIGAVDIDSLPPRFWQHMGCRRPATTEDVAYAEKVRKSLKHDARRGYKVPAPGATEEMLDASCATATLTDTPIDLDLLPSIGSMSSLQKRSLQRSLEERVQARHRLRSGTRMTIIAGRLMTPSSARPGSQRDVLSPRGGVPGSKSVSFPV